MVYTLLYLLRIHLDKHMRYPLVLLILILSLSMSCTSRSERVAKYKNKPATVVLNKIALNTVIDYDYRIGFVQYYESDTTFVTLVGTLNVVQDSIHVTRITSFRRARR